MPATRYRNANPSITDAVQELGHKVREIALAVRTRLSVTTLSVSRTATIGGALVRTLQTVDLGSDGPVVVDAEATSRVRVFLGADALETIIHNPTQGSELSIIWVQDSLGGHLYTWPSACRFAGSAPTNSTANSRTTVSFIYDGAYWYEVSRAVGVL